LSSPSWPRDCVFAERLLLIVAGSDHGDYEEFLCLFPMGAVKGNFSGLLVTCVPSPCVGSYGAFV
jgi:hypothetical protein